MKSLTSEIILQHLTYDKQVELYNLLNKSLSKTYFENVYIVTEYTRCPTGGDWCDHERTLFITGKYNEAKTYFDEKTKLYLGLETIPDDDRMPLEETFTLYHGKTKLCDVDYDYVSMRIYRHLDKPGIEYQDYEIVYPLYDVRLEFGYDTKISLGLFDTLDKAILNYTRWINETITKDDDYIKHYGFTIYILRITENYNQKIEAGHDPEEGDVNPVENLIIKTRKD